MTPYPRQMVAMSAGFLTLAMTPAVRADITTHLIGDIPAVPAPTCVGCGGQGSHGDSCPYMPRGGDGDRESPGGGDVTHAPIFVVPTGMIGGVFMGGGWFWKEMSGDFPDKGFLKSYGDYVSVESGDPLFDKPFTVGARIGGAPWLLVYLPAYPLRQGVLGVADWFTPTPKKPTPPTPPPHVAVQRAIATRYAELEAAATAELARARRALAEAESRRRDNLDRRIAESAELSALLRNAGKDAARDAAETRLQRLIARRRANLDIADSVRTRMSERSAEIRAAAKKADDAAFGFLRDLGKEAFAPPWLEKEFPLIDHTQTALDLGTSLKTLNDARRRALEAGKDKWTWLAEPETKEATRRLALKVITSAPSAKPVATVASGTETTMDIVYATATRLAYASQMEADARLLEKIATANVFDDLAADEYDALLRRVAVAKATEARLLRTQTNYNNLRRRHEQQANAASL